MISYSMTFQLEMSYTVNINGEILKSLLIQGVFDVNNFLYQAVEYNDFDLCQYLLQNGAQVNKIYDKNPYYSVFRDCSATLLHLASHNSNDKLVTLLLKYHAPINVQNSEGKTPLFYAKHLNTIKILVESGADYTLKDKYGKTPKEYFIVLKNKFNISCQDTIELQEIIDYLQDCKNPLPIKEPVSTS